MPSDAHRDLSLESTAVLIDHARDGNDDALDTLYGRHLERLRVWARGRLPSRARDVLDTDDLVQNMLMRTLKRVETLEIAHTGAFQGYLRTGVLNKIRDELRRYYRRPDHKTGIDIPDPGPSPVELAIGRERLARYENALAKLEPGDREAVVARIELGLSFAEIATELGKPSADAARMAVNRAIVRLARLMHDDDQAH